MDIKIPAKVYFKSTLVEVFNRICEECNENSRIKYDENRDILSSYLIDGTKMRNNIPIQEFVDFFRNKCVWDIINEKLI